MKSFNITLILLGFLFIVTSCEDDDPVAAPANAIAGAYNVLSFDGSFEERNQPGNTLDFRNEFSGSNFNNATFTFTADGRMVSTGTFTMTEMITSNGNTGIDTYPTDFGDFQGTYVYSPPLLTLNLDGEVVPFTVISQTPVNLVIESDVTFNDVDYSERTIIRIELERI
jgi:hypothetical protein